MHEQSDIQSKIENDRENEEANSSEPNIEQLLLGEQELEDESVSYSDRDLKKMKAIYEAAQFTLE